MSENADNDQSEIIAPPGREYRVRRYLFVGLMVAAGLWFAYDGFIGYPRQWEKFSRMTPDERAHTTAPPPPFSIRIQKELALSLLLLAPTCFAFFMYRSRGNYRLERETLFVPGHPSVQFSQIVELDKSLWDRKGIAKVTYRESSSSASQTLKLDDFIYQYQPVRQIVERIEKYLESETPASPPAEA